LINQEDLFELLGVAREDIPLFSIRRSNKAKRLIFRSSIRNGFEIVLPRSYDDNSVLGTVTQNRLRIAQDVAEIKKNRTALKPTSIVLPATGNSWEIVYREIDTEASNAVTETVTTLNVPERAGNVFWVPTLLQQWLQEKALEHLPMRLDCIAKKLKLSYNVVRIKRQRSRWGSCSIRRNINLNRNLMLMPPEVVDYILHHELIHLKVLNHSSKFWKELDRSFPSCQESLAQLKDFENNKIPEWALV